MVYRNGRRDYTLEYLCEHRFEDGTLALCIRVINHADEPLFHAGTFTGINGVEFSRQKNIMSFLGADSTGLACLYLTVSNCVDCGVEGFGDIEYIEHIQRRYLSDSNILSISPGTYRIFEYREADAHPLSEKIATDRGVVRVDAKRFSESRMIFEVRVDGATVTDPSLLDDIEAMAFISGSGDRFTPVEVVSAADGDELRYTAAIDFRHTDDRLSLCFLAVGHDAWRLWE